MAKRAFHNNGIAYLLKPVTPGLLANAIKKYFSMRRFFEEKMEHHLESLIYPPRYSQRIIVRKGREYQSIRMQDIVCFYSKFKMIHLLTLDGREYRTLKDNLNQLAITLNPDTFFKANRKYIVHIDHIRQFRILDFGKVLIEMCLPVKGEIIVSQFSGMRFRQWIGENNESRHLTGTPRY